MIREEFLRLAAAGYNRIPLARETLADFDTPLSIYLKLADQPNSYLLESVQGGEKWGRYSIIGLPCRTVLRVHDHQVSVTHDGVEIEACEAQDPLTFVEEFKARYNVPTQRPDSSQARQRQRARALMTFIQSLRVTTTMESLREEGTELPNVISGADSKQPAISSCRLSITISGDSSSIGRPWL